LTGDACTHAHGQLDPDKLRRWQAAHGIEPTGVVRRDTLAAAREDASRRAGSRGRGHPGEAAVTMEATTAAAPTVGAAAMGGAPQASLDPSDGNIVVSDRPVCTFAAAKRRSAWSMALAWPA
jgi:hypothetical protein